MSDQIERMVNDTKDFGGQFMQSYESVWMSRWKRTGCNSTTKAHNGSSNTVPKMTLDGALGEGNSANKWKVSRSVKGHEDIVSKTFEIVNEGLRTSSVSLSKEGMGFQDLSMVPTANCGSGFLFKLGQDTDDMETSRYHHEGTSKKTPEWVQSHSSGKDSPSAASKRSLEGFVKLSTEAGPFIFEREHSEFDRVKTSVRSFMGGSALISSNQLTDAKLRLGKREYHHYPEVEGHSRPRNSVTDCFRESNTSSFFDPPSMSSHHLSAFGGEWFQEMQKMPKCTHNVENMRICTTMDSALDRGGSLPRFFQAIHSLRITTKTDFNLENDILRSTRKSGGIPSDLCNLSPFYGQGKRGLKIEFLSNFTNSESRGNHVKDSEVTAKNDSSVQEKDSLSGAISISSKTKTGINLDCNSSRQTSVAFSKHAEFKRPNTELLDVNLDLRPLPATITSSEHGDPPSSRTQSLAMDILQTHAKQPKHQSNPFLDNSPVPNPSNRCTKRLKLSSSHSAAQGTKSSSKDQTLFQEKLYDNFGSIPGSAVISSEPTLRKPQDKDQHFSVNPSAKDLELLLSHAWIQRWQSNGSSGTKNKSSTMMFVDHQSSNLTPKRLPNEQLPSIAAMALMGRAMAGFQPCELRKRGSFTVWNARAV
ncbi:uncharacterized protein [Henckelia pumila]|uniref:uncharacterized protein isoform X2 n=1 Tax=Henckelia pumila TaxID=405737 RepID=UPI003C6DED7F